MTTTSTSPASVTVDTVVDAPVAHAFRVFTERIGDWWDPDHHLLDSTLVSMTFEPWVGGHVVDRYADGRECRWARVLAFEPPHRVAFSWDITTDWNLETDPSRASEVEVTFSEIDPQRTHVVLTHAHLDRHGDRWQAMRDAVGRGWTLTSFARVASAAS